MRKAIQNKLLATFALCASAALAVGFTALPETTASAATTTDVVVATAALRTPDETYGKGLRFRLTMSQSFYTANEETEYTTGVLLAPKEANEELTLTNASDIVAKQETAAWAYVEAEDVYETYVHLYDIEKTEYTTEISVCAYVDYTDDATEDLYSATVSCSVAEIAKYAYENDATLLEDEKASLKTEYLTYSLTCDIGDGSAETTSDVVYGEKLELEEPTRTNYTFDGWYNEAGTAKWDMSANTVQGNVRLFAKWTVKEKVTLIDAATESTLFSHTYVAESDSSKGQMNLAHGSGYDSAYTTVTDATHGYAIETSAKGHVLGWANFNTGITGDLKTYWTNKLDGIDKVVFYVYNGTANPHQIRLNTADQGSSTDWVTLTGNAWTMVTIEKTAFLNVFANIAERGNPYICYQFCDSNGNGVGNTSGVTIKFSSFYGYTNAGYEKEFLKTATVLDVTTDFNMLTAASSGAGYWVGACATQASFVQVDTDYGKGVEMTVTSNSGHGAYIHFDNGVEDKAAYWSEKLAGMDKIVFYFYNGTSSAYSIGFRTTDAGVLANNVYTPVSAGEWAMITMDVQSFLSNLSNSSPVYLMLADGGQCQSAKFKITSFVGYSNVAYEQAFGA